MLAMTFHFIPICLMICWQFVKIAQAMWIEWDKFMYNKKKGIFLITKTGRMWSNGNTF